MKTAHKKVLAEAVETSEQVLDAFENHLKHNRPGDHPMGGRGGGAKPSGGGSGGGGDSGGSTSEELTAMGKESAGDARQSGTTKEEIYNISRAAKPDFDVGMDTGQGVDKDLGANVAKVDSRESFEAAINAKGSTVILAPLKGEKRATEKVNNKYDGDWSRLTDVARATVAVDSKADIPKALKSVRKNMKKQGFEPVSVEDRMSNPTEAGYRDIQTLWKSKKNGAVVELQINTKAMMRAKEGKGHKVYEKYRSVKETIKGTPTPTQKKQLDGMETEMRDVYDKAWKE